jgi:uncharacterized cupredoxin-like copper-binding protein
MPAAVTAAMVLVNNAQTRSRRMPRIIALVTIAVVAAVGALTASAATGSHTPVTVKLKEFTLTPSLKADKAGKITFVVKNAGKIEHEFVVMKTNVAPGKLPVNAKSRVPEKGVVGEIGDIAAGQTKKKAFRLAPGKYVLLCNLVGHYKAGQYAGFIVR